MKLDLYYNHIGDQGVRHLVNGLLQNKVIAICTHCFLLDKLFLHFPQTLGELKIGANGIGDQGVEHLAKVLRQTEVLSISLFCLLLDHKFIPHQRH